MEKIKKGRNKFLPSKYRVACGLFFLSATRSFFGSLERVDLKIFGLDLNLDVGSKVADAVQPFFLRSRICTAYLADGAVNNSLTTLAIFNNNLT
jgi:hypothetical protein